MKSWSGESLRTLNSLLIQRTCFTFSLPRSAGLPPGAALAWKVTCSNCVNQQSMRFEGLVVSLQCRSKYISFQSFLVISLGFRIRIVTEAMQASFVFQATSAVEMAADFGHLRGAIGSCLLRGHSHEPVGTSWEKGRSGNQSWTPQTLSCI